MSTLAEHLKELQEIAADPKHGKASRWFEVAAYTMVNAHLSELVALAMHKQQVVTPDVVERRKGDTYELGQVIFNHLHGFLNAAGINGCECKLTVTVPTDADRKRLTERLRCDMGGQGSPRSAGRIGNSAGTWQGIAYEFVAALPPIAREEKQDG